MLTLFLSTGLTESLLESDSLIRLRLAETKIHQCITGKSYAILFIGNGTGVSVQVGISNKETYAVRENEVLVVSPSRISGKGEVQVAVEYEDPGDSRVYVLKSIYSGYTIDLRTLDELPWLEAYLNDIRSDSESGGKEERSGNGHLVQDNLRAGDTSGPKVVRNDALGRHHIPNTAKHKLR